MTNLPILFIDHNDRKGFRAYYLKKDVDGTMIKVYIDEERERNKKEGPEI
jgi:hypothetical protein